MSKKKVLIYRSLQLPLLEDFINKNLYKKFEIILIENGKQELFLKKEIYNHIFYLKNKTDFKITSMRIKDINKIRRMKIDFMIIPHKQPSLYGFENIILLSYFLNIKEWFHLFYKNENVDLNSLIKIKKLNIFFFLKYLIKLLLLPISITLTLLFILRMLFTNQL